MSELYEEAPVAITLGTISSDTAFKYQYPELTIGTIGDKYWIGQCEIYDRSTTFDIRDLAKVHEFKLKQVEFDDYFWIKINDHTVYVGPYDGDRVEVKNEGYRRAVSTDGENIKPCDLGTNWNKAVDVDLKPYLKEGINEIWTRTVVGGHGNSWLKILAKGHKISDTNQIPSNKDFDFKFGGEFDFQAGYRSTKDEVEDD